jgi:hypothetical protein
MIKSLVGGGIEGIADSMRTEVFTNIAIQARTFETVAGGGTVPVDENGWPTTDFLARFLTSQPVKNINGTYKFSFTGKAKVAPISSPAKVQNLVYDATTNKTTGEIVINGTTGMASLNIRFMETVGGIKDLKILRPNYDESKFTTDEFVTFVQPFSAIRFMSVTDTNENLSKTWTDRPTPEYARFGFNTVGIPWEYVIQIINDTKKDGWINIPCLVDDDYIQKLAEMFKANLNPDSVIYIEWGNEIWNQGMKASKAHSALTQQEIAAGDPYHYNGSGGDVGVGNSWWANIRRQAKKLCDAVTIFRNVFGTSRNRVRAVLGGQNANEWVVTAQIQYIEKNIGKPSDYIYAASIAPYLDLSKAVMDSPTATVDEIVNDWRARAKGNVTTNKIKAHKALLDRYNLKLCMYEGGPASGQGKVNLDNKIAAAKHPDMEVITKDYYDTWFGVTKADLALCLDLVSRYDQWGTWGLTDDQRELQPKLKGAYAAATQNTFDDIVLPWVPPVPKVQSVALEHQDFALSDDTNAVSAVVYTTNHVFQVKYDDGTVKFFDSNGPVPSGT